MEITQRKQAEEERRKLEDQLMQARKMESVGRLAGSVAHDFNNMLTPIMGYAEMLLDDLAPDDPHRSNVVQIAHSAERSKGLVMQLLAFARRQTLEMKPVNLNKVITGVKNMIQRTLQENVKIEIRQAPVLGVIQADTGQVEQIILNLSVNAQDAMPDGGAIFIETSEVVLDDAYARTHDGVAPGPYIMMSFIDTGTGMDKETLDHIFEPFYTTKGAGKGTGLGLATVYGIVKQHGGHISVYSELGKGTIFRIYFPMYEGVDAPVSAIRTKEKPLHGTETVLVVEDENQVRDITVNALRHYGYTVLEAQDGRTAQEAFNSYQGDIHLFLTDVILPDMNGRMVYTQLSSLRNELKVLYMSGYTSDVISHHGVLEPGVHFIQKPFNLQDLAHKVRDVLD
jgi:nitrogen-specific signal transduction histidine kinase